ncbi:unnamed protein product [Cyprideis torosa]|uniref:Serine/threonine-protein phosphatase PGAM5, mitochondrial n=1 Tax=Cyprideis torosa TaxID=163714 RepID=A0A7R8ZS44_9CRUS|nr:unnamed protein product [Cyprideis torosa]CAG0900676.1 unnamed protein product [Cyprideis torosa]
MGMGKRERMEMGKRERMEMGKRERMEMGKRERRGGMQQEKERMELVMKGVGAKFSVIEMWSKFGRQLVAVTVSLSAVAVTLQGREGLEDVSDLKRMILTIGRRGPHWDPNWDGRGNASDATFAQELQRHVVFNDFAEASPNLSIDGMSPSFPFTSHSLSLWFQHMTVPEPSASRHIILVRHGHYAKVAQGSDPEHRLSSWGIEQVGLLAKRLNAFGIAFDQVISSNSTRAVETTEILKNEGVQLVPNVFPEYTELLKEGSPPVPPEPRMTKKKVKPELYLEHGIRVEAAFEKFFHRADPGDDKDVFTLMVTHRNLIRYFVLRALQLPPSAWSRLEINHASLTWLIIRPDGEVKVTCIGDSGHLPKDKITHSTKQYPKEGSVVLLA